MNTDGKIKVLFITDKAHLYGDNKSLLTTLCSLDSSVERLVCVTQLGLFTDELSAAHIPFQLIEGTMTPLFMPISLKHKWLHKLLNYPIYIRKKSKPGSNSHRSFVTTSLISYTATMVLFMLEP